MRLMKFTGIDVAIVAGKRGNLNFRRENTRRSGEYSPDGNIDVSALGAQTFSVKPCGGINNQPGQIQLHQRVAPAAALNRSALRVTRSGGL